MKYGWKIVSPDLFDGMLNRLGLKDGYTTVVRSASVEIGVVTDSRQMVEHVTALMDIVPEVDIQPRYSLYFCCSTVEENVLVDCENNRFLCAGGLHYGRLKSLVSGMSSYFRSTSRQQGFHAAAFKVNGVGVVVAAAPGVGKSCLMASLRERIGSIVTDDWCDLIIDERLSAFAKQVDSGISYNLTKDGCAVDGLPSINGRICDCGWRKKIFAPLKAIGLSVSNEMRVEHIYVVDTSDTPRRNIDVHSLASLVMSTAPHTPFAYGCEAPENVKMQRLEFFRCLLAAHQEGHVSIEVVHVGPGSSACEQIESLIVADIHHAVLSELLSARTESSHRLRIREDGLIHYQYPDSLMTKICRENLNVAQRICAELLRLGVPMRALFVHGSTGRGRGQVAPNIDWSVQCDSGIIMRTWVVPNCRDDIDLVCVCDSGWGDYARKIQDVVDQDDYLGFDITLNMLGESEFMEELRMPGSPALRRIMIMNSPEVLFGEEVFLKYLDDARAWEVPLDYAHELDFRTLMRLSRILEQRGLQTFDFTEGELMSVFPTFHRAAVEDIHIGFPSKRMKIKRTKERGLI